MGVFGRDLVRWAWLARGYDLAHVVAGRGADDAYLRLLDQVMDPAESRLAAA